MLSEKLIRNADGALSTHCTACDTLKRTFVQRGTQIDRRCRSVTPLSTSVEAKVVTSTRLLHLRHSHHVVVVARFSESNLGMPWVY